MPHFTLSNPEAVRRAAPSYSLAAVVPPGAARLIVSGQVALAADGSVPEDGAAQIEMAFANLRTVLQAHGLDLPDIAKTTVFLTDRALIPVYREVRGRVMGERAPASTLLIVAGLADPRWVVEIEAEAIGPA